MARAANCKQINFVADPDVGDRLDQSENKTRDLNEALRQYYGLDDQLCRDMDVIRARISENTRALLHYAAQLAYEQTCEIEEFEQEAKQYKRIADILYR